MIVRPTFPELGEHVLVYQRLTAAANEAWRLVSPPDKAAATNAEFERLTGDDRLSSLIDSPDDADAWANAFGRMQIPGSNFQPTLGASYLKANLDRFIKALGQEDDADVQKIIWLRPSGSTWGRTARVAEALSDIRQVLKNRGSKDFDSFLLMPRSTSPSERSSHRPLFDNGLLLPQGHFPANIEVLIVPGKAAFVNAHILVGQHSVALGGLTTDSVRLTRILSRLMPGKADGWSDLWSPRKSNVVPIS